MIRGPRAGQPVHGRAHYPRSVSGDRCGHAPEVHVVYDMVASGYRAQLSCRCGRITLRAARVRDGHAQAEADGEVMLRIADAHAAAREAAVTARRAT